MILDISALPEKIEDLKALVVDYHNEIERLKEENKVLRACLFGRKSEKLPSPSPPNQGTLFDMPEPEESPVEKEIEIRPHKRRKPGRKPISDDLPREEVVIDIPEEEKTCACGAPLVRIGEEVSEKLDIIPAKMKVIRTIRFKYACKKCEGTTSEETPSVKIAPAPLELIPGSMATPGLLAYILTAKFVDHIPFYRQEQQFARLGVDISRTNMSNWAIKVAKACQPLLNLCKEEVLEGNYVHIDETTVQVLKEPDRAPTTKSYMWVFKRGDPDRPILVYEYHATRSGEVAKTFLEGYQGYVQTDGFSGYDFLDHLDGVVHVGCWAHARRKFMDVLKASGKNRKRPGSADIALDYIKRLYRIEHKAKDGGLSPEERHRLRQKEAKPLLAGFYDWLKKRSSQVPPKSLIGKAISYTLSQWDRLTAYLKDGILSMDNNAAENAIRPFVVGRKNWLFAGTPEGAEASALLYSLIETAKANGLEPYTYLRYIFSKLPLAQKIEDYEALLPWNLTPETIKI